MGFNPAGPLASVPFDFFLSCDSSYLGRKEIGIIKSSRRTGLLTFVSFLQKREAIENITVHHTVQVQQDV